MGRHQRRVIIASAVTGIGLSGFFDGILLHQVLQWHHLLSLVPGEPFRSLRTQILADGLFHVLMYLITATGLWLLWRFRREASETGWRAATGGTLLGFGLWNIIDVGFFHWTLGIHRIRINVSEPMLYDVGWLVVFGMLPVALSWRALRHQPPGASGGRTASAIVAGLALIAAPLAALPQPNAENALVLLAPGSRTAMAFIAAEQAGTPLMWADPNGGMMVVRMNSGARSRLYTAGALFVTSSPALAGCAASVQV
jgi:uncharacterized membrane protein